MAILLKLDQVIWKTNCWICWLSVLSILFVKCIYDHISKYITQLAFHLCWVILSIELFWHVFFPIQIILIDRSCCQPLIQALIWHLDLFINTSINLRILEESYMPPQRMITQLRTVYSKIVQNCCWYTDYTHCPWINDAKVTRHETLFNIWDLRLAYSYE